MISQRSREREESPTAATHALEPASHVLLVALPYGESGARVYAETRVPCAVRGKAPAGAAMRKSRYSSCCEPMVHAAPSVARPTTPGGGKASVSCGSGKERAFGRSAVRALAGGSAAAGSYGDGRYQMPQPGAAVSARGMRADPLRKLSEQDCWRLCARRAEAVRGGARRARQLSVR
jgi:hypothetical protein